MNIIQTIPGNKMKFSFLMSNRWHNFSKATTTMLHWVMQIRFQLNFVASLIWNAWDIWNSHTHTCIQPFFYGYSLAPFFNSTFRLSPQRFRSSKISRSGAANWSMLNDYRMWHIYCTTPYNKVTLRGVGEPIYDCELTMPAVKCDMSKSWQQLLVLWAKHYFGWGKEFANKLFDKSVLVCVTDKQILKHLKLSTSFFSHSWSL